MRSDPVKINITLQGVGYDVQSAVDDVNCKAQNVLCLASRESLDSALTRIDDLHIELENAQRNHSLIHAIKCVRELAIGIETAFSENDTTKAMQLLDSCQTVIGAKEFVKAILPAWPNR